MKRTNLPDRKKLIDVKEESGKGLSGRFIFPPFSILRTSDGNWQRRKRQWIALGIKSEIGRCGNEQAASYKSQEARASFQQNKKEAYRKVFAIGNKKKWEEEIRQKTNHAGVLHKGETGKEWNEIYQGGDAWSGTGTSIFDPVLCELMYSWFCPSNGQIVDPFAGGSVRGIVAHFMGYNYWGSELRLEQVEANKKQGKLITSNKLPIWVCGDAWQKLKQAPKADFIFSCPPYGNLEVYSDLENDISNMSYEDFLYHYTRIIRRACHFLKEDRFACFIVGNFRDRQGFLRDFVGDTIRAFESTKIKFYNEIILVTAIGSLPVRVGRAFTAGRKIGKTHQNVLIFYKGDPKKIKKNFSKE